MNLPAATGDTVKQAEHPRRLHRIRLKENRQLDVVVSLPKERVKNIIGDSEIALSLVPSDGVSFSFDKLSLSVFTRA